MIDFSPLDVKIPVPQKSELTDIPKLNSTAGSIIVTIVMAVILPFNGVGKLLAIVLMYPAIWFLVSKSGFSSVRLSNFAVTNGFRYSWSKKRLIELRGVIGGESPQVKVSNYITGSYEGYPFQIFNPYTRGAYTIMQIQLKKQYPHVVLDNLSNNSLFVGSITKFFDTKDSVSLEGDFDTHFRMYSKAVPTDSLRIMSPDVMGLVIDYSHDYDIELFEDNLSLIGNYKFSNRLDMQEFFNLADKLLPKLDRLS